MHINLTSFSISRATHSDEFTVAHCDFTALFSQELCFPYDDITNLRDIQPYVKDYQFSPQAWFAEQRADAVLYIATLAEKVVGYICASVSWNGMVEIDELAIDKPYRCAGIAHRLLEKIESWSKEHGFHELKLESQSTNTAAAKFYYRNGFRVEGYDKALYRCTENAPEVALFWYKSL